MTTKKTRFSTNRERSVAQRGEIDEVIESLKAATAVDLSEEQFELLSDLSRPAARRLTERWSEIDYPVRLALVREMVNRFETDVEHHYDRSLVAALSDEEDDVKLLAFEGLSDTSERTLLAYLVNHLPSEENDEVRAAGAEALGQFVLESELDHMVTDDADRVRQLIINMLTTDPAPLVRRRALESAGYLTDVDVVIQTISDAWASDEHENRVSALRAMGRQSHPRWLDTILSQFTSDEPELRFEAARSAALVGGQPIVPRLIDLTDDEDPEVQMAAIAALGTIGGDIAVTALRNLLHAESEAIADAASAALDDALLAHSVARPPGSLW